MDRHPQAVDLRSEAVRDFVSEHMKRKAELLEMDRILRDRDESRDYALEYECSGPGPARTALPCGCSVQHDGEPCEWHSYIAAELGDLREQEVA